MQAVNNAADGSLRFALWVKNDKKNIIILHNAFIFN